MGRLRFRDHDRRLRSLWTTGALLAVWGLLAASGAKAAGGETVGVTAPTSATQVAQQAGLGAVEQVLAVSLATTVASTSASGQPSAQSSVGPVPQAAASGSTIAGRVAVTMQQALVASPPAAEGPAATAIATDATQIASTVVSPAPLSPTKRTAERAQRRRHAPRHRAAGNRIRLGNRSGLPAGRGAASLPYGEQQSRVVCPACAAPAQRAPVRWPSRPSHARPLPAPPVTRAAMDVATPSSLPAGPGAIGGAIAGAGLGAATAIALLLFAAACPLPALLPGRLSLELAAWPSAPTAMPPERPG